METLVWNRLTEEPDALGESPFWHPAEQRLYWVDIAGRALRRADPRTGVHDRWRMPSEPGCIAPRAGGGLAIALRDGLYIAAAWGGPLQRLAEAPYDNATTRFNDGRADPEGRWWIGTMYEPRDQALATLMRFGPGGWQRMAGGATTGNGLAFSPDGCTLYWADTPGHVVRTWQRDPASGDLSQPREFHRFTPRPAGWLPGDAGYGGRPDGAAVDAEGFYWLAMYEGGRLLRLDPAGRIAGEWLLPLRCPTMPCFGGEDRRTLYLTSARQGRSAAELAACPDSGHVLWARVEVPGLPVNFFIDPSRKDQAA